MEVRANIAAAVTFGAQALKVQPVALNGARLARALRGDAALWVLAPPLAIGESVGRENTHNAG